MRFWILRPIVVALNRNVRHRLFHILARLTMLCTIGCSELRKVTRSRSISPEHVDDCAAGTLRKTAIAGVFQFFDAERERDVAGA